ncbi:MAG: hypothetical protein ACHQ1G_04260 [Planctomycetota bacterium]
MLLRGLPALLLASAVAVADDEKPLPLSKSVILPSGGSYFVEGRQEIAWGQELSVQKGTRITGRGEGATLVVSGALQVRGVFGDSVKVEGLVIEVAEKCERVHLEAAKLTACTIRTPEGKACDARVHLEEAILEETVIALKLSKGEVTILNSRTKGAVTLTGVPEPGKDRAVVKAFVNACNVDRDFHADGLSDLVVRACAIYGTSIRFKDCAELTFDANVVSTGVLFEQSKAGGFKKTKLQKSDFHKGGIVFQVPREGAKKDQIPVDKCWFQGRTKKEEILSKDIRDGHTDEKSGAFVVFLKINERELKLGGMTTAPGAGQPR